MKRPTRFHWDRNTESVDDYLKAIFTLESEDAWVAGSKLARHLGIAPASVTNMVQKLTVQLNSPVEYRHGQGVRLTATGRDRALEVVRHHRLVETFLVEVLGYAPDEVHDEAERLEHFISEKFEAKIAEKLGHPEYDPHGHCIPALDGTMPAGHGIHCRCAT